MENNTNQNNVTQENNNDLEVISTSNDIGEIKDEITLEELQQQREEEREKKRQEIINNYKPPSKFKTVLLVLFFVLLIGYVWFLPDVTKYVEMFKNDQKEEEKITTGILECKYSRSTENLDYEYESVFSYSDNKLSKFTYTVVTRGDGNLDKEILEKTNDDCVKLKKVSADFDGVDLSCSYSHDRVITKQIFYYDKIDAIAVSSAFVEAGGTYPEFKKGQNMDKVESKMENSQYTCKRIG